MTQNPQGPAFGQAPAPSQAQKKSRKWPWIGLAVIVILGACIGGAAALGGGDNGPKKGTAAATATSRPAPARTTQGADEEAAAEPSPTSEHVAAFGTEYFEWEDGVRAQVNWVKKFTPSSYAAGHVRGNTAVKVQITLNNGSHESLDCSFTDVTLTLGKEGAQGERVFDSDKGVGDCDGVVAPGRKKTFVVGFSVPTKDISVADVAVAPTLGHDEGTFEGKVQPK